MIALTALIATVSGTSLAQGILGTNKSFSNSAFCKNYKCELMFQKNGVWTYKTKLGDYINVSRQSADPKSMITGGIFIVAYPNYTYHLDDETTFRALQIEMFGSVKAELRAGCYIRDDTFKLGRFTYKGSERIIECQNDAENAYMLAIIATP